MAIDIVDFFIDGGFATVQRLPEGSAGLPSDENCQGLRFMSKAILSNTHNKTMG